MHPYYKYTGIHLHESYHIISPSQHYTTKRRSAHFTLLCVLFLASNTHTHSLYTERSVMPLVRSYDILLETRSLKIYLSLGLSYFKTEEEKCQLREQWCGETCLCLFHMQLFATSHFVLYLCRHIIHDTHPAKIILNLHLNQKYEQVKEKIY